MSTAPFSSAPFGTEGTGNPFSFHTGIVNVGYGDGSVKALSDGITIQVFAALVTRSGAESVTDCWILHDGASNEIRLGAQSFVRKGAYGAQESNARRTHCQILLTLRQTIHKEVGGASECFRRDISVVARGGNQGLVG